jgi:hypothetical protein
MITKTEWFKGPPPSIGWWPASLMQDKTIVRWWNGNRWSLESKRGDAMDRVVYRAGHQSLYSEDIEWTHRPKNWPKRSMT